MRPSSLPGLSCLAVLAACSSFSYDLRGVPFPVHAGPANPPAAAVEDFELRGKSVLWVHGLCGEDQPDVAALLRDACGDCNGVANFRVTVAGSFHDWLLTHLSLGFVRMKTVTIKGQRLVKAS